ncbi:MAG: DUF4398 domain-containing protein [Methyloprofundus sp.]|nr:DUF4398 domain-containing protein [Methyloprofundus sp.]
MFTKKQSASFIKVIAFAGVVASTTGCGIDAPKAEIAYAEATIHSARNVDANRYAGVDLERAKGKLHEAKSAMNEGDNEKALRLAHEATATASLAQAKAEAGKAKMAESQMKDSLNMLESQLR